MAKYCFYLLCILLTLVDGSIHAQSDRLRDYGPFDPSIPSPSSFLGYHVGNYHTRHDRIVAYFEALAEASDRLQLEQYGETHERRPLLLAAISTPANLNRLEDIKEQHIKQINPQEKTAKQPHPLILYLGYNIHGDEPSSSEAAMLVAYTLAATRNDTLLQWLQQSVILLDPVINPDGRERHTQWVNSRRSKNLIEDKYDTEHNETWPKGRTNHYWFDLNRDLYLAVHPESRARLKIFHTWLPNIYTDFHEMGTSSTYFFEPKRPSALQFPITPKENHATLNDLFKRAFAKEMDRIGDLYYTHEVFDATYPGYGSTYGDLQGGLALLFEQASSRGHVQETPTGPLRFEKTIFHQFLMSLTTIRTANRHKDYMQDYQRRYFRDALREASRSRIKGYAFGDPYDQMRTYQFISLLQRHDIQVLKSTAADHPFYVPLQQPQYRLIRHLFEDITQWRDSVFYDASAWNLVRAYNIPFQPVVRPSSQYEPLEKAVAPPPAPPFKKTAFAYLMKWDEYYSPAALYALQKEGVFTRMMRQPATLSSEYGEEPFAPGTIIISVGEQRSTHSADALYERLQGISRQYHVPFYPVLSGLAMKGIDLGSPNAPVLRPPKVALLTGEGINAYEAGEVWYTLDYKMNIEVVKIPLRIFSRVPLDRYNTLVMVSGNYSRLTESNKNTLRHWIQKGNTLITINGASKWASQHQIAHTSLIQQPSADSSQRQRIPYAHGPGDMGRRQVSGVILQAKMDTTHPLAYGYHQDKIAVYKKGAFWLRPSKNPYSTPLQYGDAPLLSGYVSAQNKKNYLDHHPASVLVDFHGRGKTILFSDDPLFRGTWLGTEKLFLNALFFGADIQSYTGSRWREVH